MSMAGSQPVSRRQFLVALGGTAAAGLVGACASPAATPPPATTQPTAPKPAPTAQATAQPAASKPAATATTPASSGSGELEIYSWWTVPGEVEALDALFTVYSQRHPNVKIINAALAGGSGVNMKAVLETRMSSGKPPDSFQVHLGPELHGSHTVAGRMEPLDDLFKSEGYDKVFPQKVIDVASWEGHAYAVPVNIHRANVLWYNKSVFSAIGATPPTTFDEFFTIAEKLKAKNIYAIAIGEIQPGHAAQTFEEILLGVLGIDGYVALGTSVAAWQGAKVTEALNIFKRMLDYVNPDFQSIGWGEVAQNVIAGKVAMQIDGDWRNGYFKAKKFTDFGWAPSPGTAGVFDFLADSFGLPKGAPNRENALNWLRVIGSREGQDRFNEWKGSIPVRSDAGKEGKYDDYQKAAMQAFKSEKLVPSICQGGLLKESWMFDFQNALNVFATRRDVAATQAELVRMAKDAGAGA